MLEQKQERAAALPREAEKKAIKALQKELAALQQPLRAAGVPVLLVFEGWSAAGKGSMIAKVISEMDPRGYQVYSAAEPTDEEARRPLLWPFWRDLPPRGEAAVLDRSWYGRVLEQMEAEHGRAGALLESVNIFERQLGDDGYLILKFFLHISQGEQKKRLEKLSGDPATAWRVTDRDWRRNRDYRRHLEAADLLLEATDTPHAPWHVIWNEEKGAGTLSADPHPDRPGPAAVRRGPAAVSCRRPALPCGVPPLAAVDLSPSVRQRLPPGTEEGKEKAPEAPQRPLPGKGTGGHRL
jgi:polyphosphate kinase 2 (PPK2 family)